LGWVVAAAFVVSAVLNLLLAFDVFGPPPERGEDFIQYTLEMFAWEEQRWVLDFPASVLITVGFLALAGLGSALARLAHPSDARRGLVTSSFLVGGSLTAASQLLWIGAKPIATSTTYCDCGFLQEEIMSRLMIQNVLGGVQLWLSNGGLAALAVGAALVATMPAERRALPQWWRRLTLVIAGLSVIAIVLPFFDVYPFDVLLYLVIAGLLLPIWAIWIANRPTEFWPHEVTAVSPSQ
jgi:hypothetical protein